MPTIILFAPLVGALICGFGYRLIGERPALIVATGLVFLACLLSWIVFLGHHGDEVESVSILRWIDSGSLSADWAIRLDTLTAIMLVVVTTVSALVHLYSFGYMDHDVNWKEGESYQPRFFAYLSFFTFAMLMLVTADNLLQMFFGWEGVGVASYLLIGFYYRKSSANAAAIKAFIVNRVGDFGFMLGIFALFLLVDSVAFDDIFAAAPGLAEQSLRFLWRDWNAAEVVSVLLFIGAMGKSAQLFLHTWLPDAMEGPTPVSALIHAATMVTAGVFLVCRMSPVLEWAPYALTFVTYIGAATAFFAATVGLVQNDIKRVIAYSTCSQLGFMFVAAGVGAYPAAMFHLFTHAFFKALLFLGAGSVIHAMHHEQDMREYGGLRTKIPYTFWAMLIGTLAITGVGIPLTYIGFAGFLSKDAIVESAYAGGTGGGRVRLLDAGDRCGHDELLQLAADVPDLLGRTARRSSHPRARPREPAGDADPARGAGARRGGRWHDLVRRLLRPPLRRVLRALGVLRAGEPRDARRARGAEMGEGLALRRHGGRALRRLLVLHPAPRPAGQARGAAAGALPVPAEQVVFRRALRLDVRAAGDVARQLPVEEGRRATVDGGIDGCPWGSCPT
jgi:proton-translocating NADH-quinone oxidoreductase chain L